MPDNAPVLETAVTKLNRPNAFVGNPGSKLRERIGIRTKEDKEEKPKVEDKPEVKPDAKAKPAKKPAKAPAALAPTPAFNPDDLKTAVVEGVAEGLKRNEPEPPKVTDGLTESEQKKFATLERMEKLYPHNAGKSQAYAAAMKKLAEYRKDWERENKGKKFNIEDEEHSEFMASNNVDWDADEYYDARADIMADKKTEAALKPIEQKLIDRETSEALAKRVAEETPKVIAHRTTTAKVLFNQLGDLFKDVLKQDGTPNGEVIGKMLEENPILERVFPLAEATERAAITFMQLARGHVQFNPENESHRECWTFCLNEEKKIQAMPAEQQLNQDGKKFATSVDFMKMSKAEQAAHWHLNEIELSTLFAFEQAKKAKKIMEDDEKLVEKVAAKRGYKKADVQKPVNGAPANGAPAANGSKQPEAISHRPTPSPAGNIRPNLAPVENVEPKPEKSLTKRIFGR